MRSIRDMEKEAARIAALSPEARARHDADLLAHRRAVGLEPGPLDEIAEERRRQVEAEGWTTQHDDAHGDFEMARAAACYATLPWKRTEGVDPLLKPLGWPWSVIWWKPSSDRRDLIKAAALIVAEIERLDRRSDGKSAA